MKIPIEEITRRLACFTSAKLDKKISATEASVRHGELILELIETGTIKDGSGFDDKWAWATSADELRGAIRVGRLQEIMEADPRLIENQEELNSIISRLTNNR